MKPSHSGSCPSRRDFLRRAATSASALTVGGLLPAGFAQEKEAAAAEEAAAAATSGKPESLVKTLYDSLTEIQQEVLLYPFDHDLRKAVDNNWHITPKDKSIGRFLNADQQAMVKEIFMNLHSEEYRDEVLKQVDHDNGGRGLNPANIAIFGEPGTGKFEFVLTSRHVTRRCDGDSVEGMAFGGPIFYGHAAESFNEKPDHPGNVYWFQAQSANELYQMLDGKQQTQALQDDPRRERGTSTVRLKGDKRELEGLPVGDMSKDQKGQLQKVLADLLKPFRKEDADESLKLLEKAGLDSIHLAFYKNHDLGGDGVWDTWQLESPHMVWHFRGKPHVHTWVHIRDPKVV